MFDFLKLKTEAYTAITGVYFNGKKASVVPCSVFPTDMSVVQSIDKKGFASLSLFKDGNWYKMPSQEQIHGGDFYWLKIEE